LQVFALTVLTYDAVHIAIAAAAAIKVCIFVWVDTD